MKLSGCTVALTGAGGAIGSAMALAIAARGARLILLGRNAVTLQALQQQLPHAQRHRICSADITRADDRAKIAALCAAMRIDVLINNAGISEFGMFAQGDDARIAEVINTNLIAPMQLTRLVLPQLLLSPRATLINVGSGFGSIGFPGYAVYCASKFGLRGFTETLRRELADQPIRVHYLGPRATASSINPPAATALNRELKSAIDDPQVVAKALLQLLQQARSAEKLLGWPEQLFMRINGLWPGLIDKALRKQLDVIKRHAGGEQAS